MFVCVCVCMCLCVCICVNALIHFHLERWTWESTHTPNSNLSSVMSASSVLVHRACWPTQTWVYCTSSTITDMARQSKSLTFSEKKTSPHKIDLKNVIRSHRYIISTVHACQTHQYQCVCVSMAAWRGHTGSGAGESLSTLSSRRLWAALLSGSKSREDPSRFRFFLWICLYLQNYDRKSPSAWLILWVNVALDWGAWRLGSAGHLCYHTRYILLEPWLWGAGPVALSGSFLAV